MLFFLKKKLVPEKMTIFLCWEVKLKMKNGRFWVEKKNEALIFDFPANRPFWSDLARSRRPKHRFLIKSGPKSGQKKSGKKHIFFIIFFVKN